MNYPRIYKAKDQIVAYFESSIRQVFTETDLEEILGAHYETWQPAKAMAGYEFASFLHEIGSLTPLIIEFPHRTVARHLRKWDEVTPFEIAGSLTQRGYLSHRSAMELHGLTTTRSSNIYVNEEQSSTSPSGGQLSQEGINRAFRKEPRTTNRNAQGNSYTFYHLNGKNTNHLGVISLPVTDRKLSTLLTAVATARGRQAETDDIMVPSVRIRLTDLERTLIDATVRPAYAGGVDEVLRAYQMAAGKLSIQRLAGILRDIAHIYPYHQSIGFYLERSGVYNEADLKELYSMETQHDFYLDYAMEEPLYCARWRIYYPASLETKE